MDVKLYKKERLRINELKDPESGRQNGKLQLSPVNNKRNGKLSEFDTKSLEEQSNSSLASNKATLSSGGNISFQGIECINIKLHYFIYKEEKEIDILINEDKTIKDLIHFSLNIINEQLISEKLNIILDTKNYNKYCIKILNSNKNNNIEILSPVDLDMPIINCNIENKFYLIWLDRKNSNVIEYKNNKINENNYNNKNYYNNSKNNNFNNKEINNYNLSNSDNNYIKTNNIMNNNINNDKFNEFKQKKSDNNNKDGIPNIKSDDRLIIEPDKNCYIY